MAGVLPQAQVAHCLTAVDVALTKEEMDHVPVALREGVEEDLTAARAMLDRVNRCYQGARLFADLLALPVRGGSFVRVFGGGEGAGGVVVAISCEFSQSSVLPLFTRPPLHSFLSGRRTGGLRSSHRCRKRWWRPGWTSTTTNCSGSLPGWLRRGRPAWPPSPTAFSRVHLALDPLAPTPTLELDFSFFFLTREIVPARSKRGGVAWPMLSGREDGLYTTRVAAAAACCRGKPSSVRFPDKPPLPPFVLLPPRFPTPILYFSKTHLDNVVACQTEIYRPLHCYRVTRPNR